ncbi:Microtubule-associated protein CRIPT domain containing protein [Rhypophila sp. PSN 637]
MVCAKCQKKTKTTLATPGVKKKSEMYYGSPASSSSSSSKPGEKKSATLGQTGISKNKLVSKAAKNPYAQYSSTCTRCSKSVSEGFKYCNQCAYRSDLCAVCGKSNKKTTAAPGALVSGENRTFK